MIFAPQPNYLCCAKIRLTKVQYNANVSALTLIAVRSFATSIRCSMYLRYSA